MSGAFIAIADDATAASWNPGGLTQLERPEVSIVFNYKKLSEDLDSSPHPELNGNHDTSFGNLNYASFAYPVPRTFGGRNLVFSLNFQRKFDFDRNLDITFTNDPVFPGGVRIDRSQTVDYEQSGQLSAFSPAVGFELTDKLSVGLAVNIFNSDLIPNNDWKTRNNQVISVGINGASQADTLQTVKEDFDDFRGTNVTVGVLFKPTEHLSIGAVYHSKFTADVDYKISITQNSTFLGSESRDKEYTFPSAIGLGLAYRFPNDKLTLSFDVTRRQWDQFIIKDPDNSDPTRVRTSGVTGLDDDLIDVDPTWTIRVGGEYVFIKENSPRQNYLPSVRAGFFYDPAPAGDRKDSPDSEFSLSSGSGNADNFYGVSLGLGLLIKSRINIDAAYIYRWGNGARADTLAINDTDIDAQQHSFFLSTVIYF